MDDNFFEVKESRKKFLFLGTGALIVALPLLILAPRVFSVMTLAGVILAFVGSIMLYKTSHLKTLLRIDRNGLYSPTYGEVSWSQVQGCTAETISRNSLFTIHCIAPREPLLVDLSMSDLHAVADLKKAMAHYSGNAQLGED